MQEFLSKNLLKASVLYFYIFHQIKAFEKLWKLRLVLPIYFFSFLRYSNVRTFSPLPPLFAEFIGKKAEGT